MMAESDDEWERSKENIQPIQQGRKQKVLKVALAPHPEDLIMQQRQAFEHELRTYSGTDILSVWCKYIKWVEQNFPKGGREGQIKQLIERCLAILKDEKKYNDDERFVDILLKFSNMSEKPLDVFNYMYTHSIGCKLAKFFITWAWELEQFGNLKKANQVLNEGIKRRAEPLEKLRAYQKDFDVRLASKIREGTENPTFESDSRRSAFAMLKPQKQKIAPIERTGEAVVDHKNPLLLGKQKQPNPAKNSIPSKVPFKIYNSENVAPSLPVQSTSVAPAILNYENSKENEQKPSKWNKVKVKPRVQSIRLPNEVNPDFKFHCDEESASDVHTPRYVPKTSSVLSTRGRSPSPVMALFEPPNPLKKPMYPKKKVYGGAVEYSLEEIRAAEWIEKKRMKKQELLLKEQDRLLKQKAKENEELEKEREKMKREIDHLTKKMQILKSIGTPDLVSGMQGTTNLHAQMKNKSNESLGASDCKMNALYEKQASSMHSSSLKDESKNLNFSNRWNKSKLGAEEITETKTDTTSYREADKMVQDLYNRSLFHGDQSEYKTTAEVNAAVQGIPTSYLPDSASVCSESVAKQELEPNKQSVGLPFNFYHDHTTTAPSANCYEIPPQFVMSVFQSAGSKQPATLMKQGKIAVEKSLPFELYQDPTTVSGTNYMEIPAQSAAPYEKQVSHSKHNPATDCENPMHPAVSSNSQTSFPKQSTLCNQGNLDIKSHLPFTFYHDATEEIKHKFPEALAKASRPSGFIEPKVDPHQVVSKENQDFEGNDENVPPRGYVQEKNCRELAGILEPSKNILYIPLEEQEDSQDDDEVCQPRVYDINETLIPPSNTEQFSTDLFLASTPCASRHAERRNCLIETTRQTASPTKLPETNYMPPPQNFGNSQQVIPKMEDRSSRGLTAEICLPKVLSTIMETSSENYSKSSSSSNSSASLTKSGHLDPSSARRPKMDTLSSITEVPDSVFSESHLKLDKLTISKKGAEEAFKLHKADFDPFDPQETLKHLKSIDLTSYDNLHHVNRSIKSVKADQNLSETNYRIHNLIAEGAYAKVYQASKLSAKHSSNPRFSFGEFESLNKKIALKVCKNSNEWEFFVSNEIARRLARLNRLPDVKKSFMYVTSAVKFTDGIALETEYSSQGTLLDVINHYKKKNASMPEAVVMYLTYEILHIVSSLHDLNIVHGDIKPDNFLLMNTAFGSDVLNHLSQSTSTLRLIDFGRAIDLCQYKRGICFTTTLSSAQFKCIEMREGKAWVFQLDWYGVLSCIYAMLFSEYMSVKKRNDKWETEKKFKRYWYTSLWEPLFSELLNIPACYVEPNIKRFTDMIETRLQQNSKTFIFELRRLSSEYLANRKLI